MYNLLKKICIYATAVSLIGTGVVFAHGEDAPPEILHPATQIGLPDAKAGHAHGGGGDAAHSDEGSGDAHGGHQSIDMSANFEVRIEQAGASAAQTPLILRFVFVEKAAGMQIKNFEITHEKQLHLIIVSSDLEEFYHEHPIFQADGTFVLENFTFPRELGYTLFFDLKPTGTEGILLRKDIAVGQGEAIPPFLKSTQFPVITSGIRMDLKSSPATIKSDAEVALTFRLANAATGALLNDVESYLAAPAHLVVLSEASLDYLHMHPLGDIPTDPAQLTETRFGPDIKFVAVFPKAGSYKGWLQLKRAGIVTTLPFIVDVAPGEEHVMVDGSAMTGDHHAKTAQAGLTRTQVAELVHETQMEETTRSIVKFAALTLLILGMLLLFYPKKPVPAPPQAALVAQPVTPESKAGMPYDPLE